MSTPPVTEVFYDGACPVCRREIALWQGNAALSACAFRDVAGNAPLPEGLDRAAALARFHVRLPDGRIVAGAAAFLALWKATRAAPLARALDRQPFLALLDLAYAGFLRLRRLWRRSAVRPE